MQSKAESGKPKADVEPNAGLRGSAFRFPLSAFSSVLLTTAVLSTFLSGCRAWNPWGKGFDDEYSNLGANARSGSDPNPGAPSLGLSAKSRQIERNLGIQ